MQTQLSTAETGTGIWNRYVNKAGSNKSNRFSFEREIVDGEWAYDLPVWNINYTEDGYNYSYVGCVTAFPGDGVKATIRDMVEGSDPFTVFEEAVAGADESRCEEIWFAEHQHRRSI